MSQESKLIHRQNTWITRAQRGQPTERLAGGVEAGDEHSDVYTSRGVSPSSKMERSSYVA